MAIIYGMHGLDNLRIIALTTKGRIWFMTSLNHSI